MCLFPQVKKEERKAEKTGKKRKRKQKKKGAKLSRTFPFLPGLLLQSLKFHPVFVVILRPFP